MNRSLIDVEGQVLLISNFTLYGDCSKGRRPGFDASAEPDIAESLYEKTTELIKQRNVDIKTGIFAAHIHVESTNDGPIIFILEA